MIDPSPEQGELSWYASSERDGYAMWQRQRREVMAQLARKLGLPLGHSVEVWLRGDIRLRGTLRLREEMLFMPDDREAQLQLTVDGVHFTTGEMESCVRSD
jgi:lysophospholipase L1-like esterase